VGRGLVERASGGDLRRDLRQDDAELEALVLLSRKLERLEQRGARGDQRRELMEERQGVVQLEPLVWLARHPRVGRDPFLERQGTTSLATGRAERADFRPILLSWRASGPLASILGCNPGDWGRSASYFPGRGDHLRLGTILKFRLIPPELRSRDGRAFS